ncbi:MAG: 2-oxoacid:acceptor oxidoreductase family protein [Pseudomonadota bacterium]
MIRIRVNGRGGQGAATLTNMLCAAVTYEGKFGQSCQGIAIERRGAPIEAYGRIDDMPIAERGMVLNPDYVIVLDPNIARATNVEAGLGDKGELIVNSTRDLGFKHKTTYIGATSVALNILNAPITNTVMLGAFIAATGLTSWDSLEQGSRFILARKSSQEKVDINIEAIKAGYEEVKRGKGIH